MIQHSPTVERPSVQKKRIHTGLTRHNIWWKPTHAPTNSSAATERLSQLTHATRYTAFMPKKAAHNARIVRIYRRVGGRITLAQDAGCAGCETAAIRDATATPEERRQKLLTDAYRDALDADAGTEHGTEETDESH